MAAVTLLIVGIADARLYITWTTAGLSVDKRHETTW